MKLNILFLCDKPKAGNNASAIVDHIDAFEQYSSHHILLHSHLGDFPDKLNLDRFDVIIIHYSLCLFGDYCFSRKAKQNLNSFKGLKVVFIQDEYRQVNKMIEEMVFIDFEILFTCFPEKEMDHIYPKEKLPKLAKYNNLTGYIPKWLINNSKPLIKDRSIDIGYRGRKLPFWYGELTYEKWNIVDKWHAYTKDANLNSDISYCEEDRIYGQKWINFLTSCKAVLGVESGASVIDFTGELERSIDMYQSLHPDETFYEVQQKFLLAYDGKYHLNQISPRCFEAIALKTVLVLYEGEYSGILKPWRHFIPLKKDFSNIATVLDHLHDDDFLQDMANTAFNEIALNKKYSYKVFIERVDGILLREFQERFKKPVIHPYNTKEFKRHIKYIPIKTRIYKIISSIYQRFPTFLRLIIKGIFRRRLVKQSAL